MHRFCAATLGVAPVVETETEGYAHMSAACPVKNSKNCLTICCQHRCWSCRTSRRAGRHRAQPHAVQIQQGQAGLSHAAHMKKKASRRSAAAWAQALPRQRETTAGPASCRLSNGVCKARSRRPPAAARTTSAPCATYY